MKAQKNPPALRLTLLPPTVSPVLPAPLQKWGGRLVWALVFGVSLFCAQLVWLLEYDIPMLSAALWGLAGAWVLFTVAWCLPRRRKVFLLAALGVFVLAAVLLWQRLATGAVFAAQLLYSRFTVAFSAYYNVPPPTGWEGTQAFGLLLFFFMLLWGAAVALSVLWLRSFWLNFCLTAPFLLIAFEWDFMPPILPTALLFGSWFALLLKRPAGVAAKGQPGRGALNWQPLAAMLMAITLTGTLVLAVPRQNYLPGEFTLRLRELPQEIRDGTGWFSNFNFNFGPANRIGARASAQVPLSGSGRVSFDNTPALRLRGQADAGLYLRGFSCAVYTGEAWRQLDDADYEAARLEHQPLAAPVEGDGTSQLQIERLTDLPYYHTPYLTTSAEDDTGAPLGYRQDAYRLAGEAPKQYVVQFHNMPVDDFLQYYTLYANLGSVYSSGALPGAYSVWPQGVDFGIPITQSAEEAAYLAYATEVYTQLPNGLGETLLELARQAGILPTADPARWAQTAQDVSHYLARIARYTLEPGVMPPGVDFAEFFLTESRAGYCVHFATAGAAMLRALGVPTRYVEGYVVPRAVRDNFQVEVTERNAHAWVEIWLPGLGWTPVEVTPGGANVARELAGLPSNTPAPGGASSQAPTADSSAPKDDLPPDASDNPQSDPSQPQSSAQPPGGTDGDGGAWPAPPRWLAITLLCLLGAGVVMVVLLLGLRAHRRRRQRRFRGKNRNHAALEMYAYLEKLRPFGAQPSAEATELAGKARFSQHTLSAEECATLLRETRVARATLIAGLPRHRRLWLVLRGL